MKLITDTQTHRQQTHTHTRNHTNECKPNWGNVNNISGLCQYQYPDCDIVLQFCSMLPLGETMQSA